MVKVSTPLPTPNWNEQDRIKALEAYEILDTPEEQEFEDIVRIASEVCNTPIAIVNFVSSERQWFKARIGFDARETSLDVAICAHAILQPGLFVVPDTTADPRFQNNPLVTGDPHLRFYAGALLETAEGLPLGTMCVLDYQPRELTEKQSVILQALARQVMTQLELRQALKAKTTSEQRLTLALQASGFVGTYEWDMIRDRVFADARFVSIFGGEPSWTTEGAPIAEYIKAIHPDDVTRVKTRIEQAVASGELFKEEYRLMQKDGSIQWIEARGKCHFDESGKPVRFPGVAVDITERKLSEAKALEAADRFRFMAEFMPHKIWTATKTGEIDFFNHQWMEYTGLSFDEIKHWGWTRFMHPEDLETTMSVYQDAVARVKPFELQHRFRRHDGVYRWHLGRGEPMHNEKGELVMWMGANTDIDEQSLSKIELEQTALNLEMLVQQRTQKLSETINELEAFSYSISHDMRAPLRSMIGFSEILKEEYGPQLDATGKGYLDRIGNASRRMDKLIQDVLNFSRLSRQEIQLERIETEELLREIIQSYPNLHSDRIDISMQSPLLPVKGSQALLTQCFSNLLDNASKFVVPGVKPRVEIWSENRGEGVRLFFKDNGIGLSEHSLEKIFMIFQRVGRHGEGTGIGLAIVRKAVEKMGGQVRVRSELGNGSTFEVDLLSA